MVTDCIHTDSCRESVAVPVHTLAVLLAYTGATLGVVMVVPQIVRTVRHPALAGVSALSWALLALACATWMTYGLRTETWPQVPGNVFLVSGAAAVALLVPSALSRTRRAAALSGAAVLVLGVAMLLPAHSVGYLALGIGLCSALPQVYESVARGRRRAASGLSLPTWAMRVAGQGCWLTYAILARDVPVVLSASVALSTAATIVTVESSRRPAPTAAVVAGAR